MRSVYIHIPFCKNICSYCDFCKFYYNKRWSKLYLDELSKEISSTYEEDDIATLYIGGGTPSCLDKEDLYKLFSIIKVFKLNKDCEFTFECNINDINEELLSILKSNGVNRLSIGVQSFNKDKLHYLNRKHNKKDIKNNILLCRKYGFNNINVDFMYAIPGETFGMMKRDLKNFIKLDVEHISTYSLIIENHTMIKNLNAKPISEELDAKMYKYIYRKLSKKNFRHYEVSNYALNNCESKHNITYWKNNEYYGFGLGAHAYINNVRIENTRNLNKYLAGDYRLNELFMSNIENMENYVILGLRLLDGISISEFENRYNKSIFDVFKINEAINNKYLIKDGDYLKISEDKIYIMNEIINYIM